MSTVLNKIKEVKSRVGQEDYSVDDLLGDLDLIEDMILDEHFASMEAARLRD